MKLLQGRRCSTLMNGQGRLLRTLGSLTFLWLMITIMEKIEFPAGITSDVLLLLLNICELGSKLFWFTLNLITTWDGLSYVILKPKYALASLLSFGVMFTLTSYLVVLTLKLNGKRVRCRVNSRN